MAKGEGGGWRPGGGSGPVRVGPKADWMPTAAKPKSRSRQLKMAGLALLFLLLIVGIVLLIYLLRDPSPPVLIIITTDPAADATDLHAPIDPYGWMSAKDLVKWSVRNKEDSSESERKHAPNASDGSDQFLNNDTIKSEAALADWALGETRHIGRLRRPSETAIIYFGLHTGADSNGPYVYVNKGRRFKVAELLQSLSEKLGETKVLVLFDPGRQLPEPTRGVLNDGFVQAMKAKEMSETLAKLGNITVILGCDEGERGWESEELKRTAFANALVEGLGGGAPATGGDKYLTALDLFKWVKPRVREWTAQNRPTTQNPVLLPAEDGERRAAETKLMLHHASKDEKAAPSDPMPGLMKRWAEYSALAMLKRPGPEVYAPRHWRRYRELLLRYEHAARSGHLETAGAVERAMETEATGIRAAQAAAFIGGSRTASGPMWQASGKLPAIEKGYNTDLRKMGLKYLEDGTDQSLQEIRARLGEFVDHRVAYSDQLLQIVINAMPKDPSVEPEGLKRRAILLRELWKAEAVRPPDVQLFLMFHQFSEIHNGEPWPSEIENGKMLFQRALLVRRTAEEAALGPVTPDHPYSEAVWRIVRNVVDGADASRRRAEDLLFAQEAERKPAFALFDAAEKKYAHAMERADSLRKALSLRDEAMADLPFLGRWAAFQGEDRFDPKPFLKLWADVHKMAEALDSLPPENADGDAAATASRFAELAKLENAIRSEYRLQAKSHGDKVTAESDNPQPLQDDWLTRERLLLVPPLKLRASAADIEVRSKIVKKNREATQTFIDEKNKTAVVATDRTDKERSLAARKERVFALGHLALSELGKTLMETQSNEDRLSTSAAIGELLKGLNDKSWDETAKAGDRLLEHYRALAKRDDPVATDAKSAEAERFSRSAVLPQLRDGNEPAVINRDFHWQVLFAGQARRTVLDHWYDDPRTGNTSKYFDNIAKAYCPDLPKAGEEPTDKEFPKRFGADEYKQVHALRAAKSLDFVTTPDDSSWTTEPQKQVAFALTTGVLPPDSAATVWGAFDPKIDPNRKMKLTEDSTKRIVLPLLSDKSIPLISVLEPPMDAKSVRESARVRRSAFFRGQVLTKDAPVELRRAPDVIATHVRQQVDPPRVAFVGRNDIDVGTVTLIIDYSPSMTEIAKGQKESRLDRLWKALETILPGLPDKTKLRVRGFGVAPKAGVTKTNSLPFESALTAGVSDQTPNGFDPLDKDKTVSPGTHDRRIFEEEYTVAWGERPSTLSDFIESLKPPRVPLHKTGVDSQGRKDPDFRYGVNSPVVRSMINAVREEFNDPNDVGRKVLIVLTDGADNSCYEYENGVGTRSDGRSLKALSDEFLKGKGQGVTPHILLIKDEFNAMDKKAIEEFEGAAKATLAQFKSKGSIHFEELDKLAKTLAELLRPRVIMSRDRRDDVEMDYKFDEPKWEKPVWSGPLAGDRYETWVRERPADGPTQRLEFAPADRFLVKVSRPDTTKPAKFERALWGTYGKFGDALKKENRVLPPVNNWQMSIPHYGATASGHQTEFQESGGALTLDLTAAVEDVRTDGQPLRQPAPAFAWWELSAEGPVAAPNATLYTWREYKNPAPSWRIRRWNWTDAAKDKPIMPKSTLNGWVETREGDLRPPRATTTLVDVGSAWSSAAGGEAEGRPWKAEWKSADDAWTVQFSWESHAFALDPDKDKTEIRPCLAVRVYSKKKDMLPDGKTVAPYFVQIDKTRVEEHRFFREIGAYTGYFELEGTPPGTAKGRIVTLYSVADLANPKAGTPLTFSLPERNVRDPDPIWNSWGSWGPELPQPTKTP